MNSHKTAITRKIASVPSLFLAKQGLLKGSLLDYGCGKGKDAERHRMDKYDPYYFPEYPHRKYDTITCIYVLNVIQNEKERDDVVENIQDLLKLKGTAYIAVRRDIPKNGTESQVWVELDLPIIRNHPNYTIYELTK